MIKRKDLISSLQQGDPEEMIVADVLTIEDIMETAKEREIELTREDATDILKDYSADKDDTFFRYDPLDPFIEQYRDE